jgi:hypothetical protein
MKLTRRHLSTRLALTASVAGTAGCLDFLDGRADVTFSGNVHSEEPLIEGAEISADDPYPNHYSRLVTTKEEEQQVIRWEYIQRELPGLVDDLEGTDFDSEFLVFIGLLLPGTKQLETGTTRIEDDTLHAEFYVTSSGSGNLSIGVNTALKRVTHDDPPSEVTFSVEY